LQRGFFNAGYFLATTVNCQLPALLEVYPHVALLGLTGCGERLPYKVGRSSSYWREQSAEQRKRRLIKEWQIILERLGAYIDDIYLPLPDPREHSFEYLKRFEDAIDGLVCAWMATQFLDKSAVALGDEEAAIWIPLTSMQFAKEAHVA
jgi:predicted RNase H-like nuclease